MVSNISERLVLGCQAKLWRAEDGARKRARLGAAVGWTGDTVPNAADAALRGGGARWADGGATQQHLGCEL